MEDFFKLVGNFGFPMVIAGYLLFRYEKKMDMIVSLLDDREEGVLTLLRRIMDKLKIK